MNSDAERPSAEIAELLRQYAERTTGYIYEDETRVLIAAAMRVEDLVAQRDELARALREILDLYDAPSFQSHKDIARAALASAGIAEDG